MNRGCCTALHLRADNARFLLLAVFMMIYMISGALLFMWLEQDNERRSKEEYKKILVNFRRSYPMVNESDLKQLLQIHGEAFSSGLLEDKRQRWDFSGSFYFVGTVVSTIGFGMTTPRTLPGKIVLIAYGFLGCAGGILFFNLFLERIITFWAFILRSIHNAQLRRKLVTKPANSNTDSCSMGRDRRDSCVTDEDSLDQWKPSVYKVQFLLLITAVGIASCASAVYHPVERWSYFDAIYFCFVTFATIGFGDYVVSQQAEYPALHWYRCANFFFILLGCCCIYSFFNVTSLVIRSFLDVVIRRLNINCYCCRRGSRGAGRSKPYLGRSRRNAITADHFADMAKNAAKRHSFDSNYDSNGDSRYSDEMISMQDFLQTNKVALAMIQKQLYETAQRSRGLNTSDALQGGVGPLAIVDHKFGQEELC